MAASFPGAKRRLWALRTSGPPHCPPPPGLPSSVRLPRPVEPVLATQAVCSSQTALPAVSWPAPPRLMAGAAHAHLWSLGAKLVLGLNRTAGRAHLSGAELPAAAMTGGRGVTLTDFTDPSC